MTSPQNSQPPITIAVVSWNTRDLLARCLDSLREAAQAGLTDVWVVDNASQDGSASMVEERYPWVTLVASQENLGYGAAVNLVANRTVTPWIAAANADLEFEPGALESLLAHGELHPEAGLVAPQLILLDGQIQHSVYPFPSVPFTLAFVLGLTSVSRHLARRWRIGSGFDASVSQEVPWAVGALVLVRRPAWTAIGGFDAAQWMYAEDLDLGWRLRQAGWTSRYEPSARVHHAESASTVLAWGDSRHARWHASTYAWLMRRRGPLLTRLVAWINICGFLLRASLQLPAATLGHGPSSQARRDALNAARAHRVGLQPRGFLLKVR